MWHLGTAQCLNINSSKAVTLLQLVSKQEGLLINHSVTESPSLFTINCSCKLVKLIANYYLQKYINTSYNYSYIHTIV